MQTSLVKLIKHTSWLSGYYIQYNEQNTDIIYHRHLGRLTNSSVPGKTYVLTCQEQNDWSVKEIWVCQTPMLFIANKKLD